MRIVSHKGLEITRYILSDKQKEQFINRINNQDNKEEDTNINEDDK